MEMNIGGGAINRLVSQVRLPLCECAASEVVIASASEGIVIIKSLFNR